MSRALTGLSWAIRFLSRGVATALLAFTCPSAMAQSCGVHTRGNAGEYEDRSWIKSDAVLFGAREKQGVFRLRLNSNRLEPIGDHAGASISDFKLSADHTKLIYHLSDSGGDGAHWLYDIKTGRETKLESLTKAIGPWDDLAYSADASKVAFVPRPGDGEAISIMDLRTRRASSYALPAATPVRDTILFGLTWSRSETEVLVGRRWREREDFWSINPSSGAVQKIAAKRVAASDPTESSIHYFRNGVDIGNDCIMCGTPRGASAVRLAGGARAVRTSKGDLAIERPGAPAITFAKAEAAQPVKLPSGELAISACDGVQVGLLGAFDGRYIVYSRNGDLWVYGLSEARRAILPGTYLVW